MSTFDQAIARLEKALKPENRYEIKVSGGMELGITQTSVTLYIKRPDGAWRELLIVTHRRLDDAVGMAIDKYRSSQLRTAPENECPCVSAIRPESFEAQFTNEYRGVPGRSQPPAGHGLPNVHTYSRETAIERTWRARDSVYGIDPGAGDDDAMVAMAMAQASMTETQANVALVNIMRELNNQLRDSPYETSEDDIRRAAVKVLSIRSGFADRSLRMIATTMPPLDLLRVADMLKDIEKRLHATQPNWFGNTYRPTRYA